MINVAILGSTGSIGTQTLDVIAANPGLFRLCAVAAHSNHRLLRQQIQQFHPDLAVLVDDASGKQFVVRRNPGRTGFPNRVCGPFGGGGLIQRQM